MKLLCKLYFHEKTFHSRYLMTKMKVALNLSELVEFLTFFSDLPCVFFLNKTLIILFVVAPTVRKSSSLRIYVLEILIGTKSNEVL